MHPRKFIHSFIISLIRPLQTPPDPPRLSVHCEQEGCESGECEQRREVGMEEGRGEGEKISSFRLENEFEFRHKHVNNHYAMA